MAQRQLDAALAADLWVFRTAAGARNFRLAADRLAVTQSAVSQRVQRLEARLGVELFVRSGRTLRLTVEGRLLFERTAEGFDSIADGLRHLRDQAAEHQLKVSCVPSLALEWLTPRLPRFLAANPSTVPVIYGETHDLDRARFAEEAVDVAIRYDPGRPTALHVAFEWQEWIFPVAAPAYRDGIADLLARGGPVTLLHDAMPWPQAAATAEWDLWIAARGLPWQAPRRDLLFNLAQLAYRAAGEGSGIAMGRALTVGRHLAVQRLVAVTDAPPLAVAAYRALTLAPPASGSAVARFVGWLEGEMRAGPG